MHDLKTGPAKGKVGTKGFWAPEQLDKKTAYTEACDLWTLGVCAYHWSTGTIPFHSSDGEEATNAATMAGDYSKDDPHLKQSSKSEEKGLFRPQLKELCEALLVVDAEKRLGTKTMGGCTR